MWPLGPIAPTLVCHLGLVHISVCGDSFVYSFECLGTPFLGWASFRLVLIYSLVTNGLGGLPRCAYAGFAVKTCSTFNAWPQLGGLSPHRWVVCGVTRTASMQVHVRCVDRSPVEEAVA